MYNFFEGLKHFGPRVAFSYFRNERIVEVTYDEYLNDIYSCFYNLQDEKGQIEGKHIGIISANSYEYLVLLAAIILGNGVAVPLNIRDTNEGLLDTIKDADIDLLVTDEDHLSVSCDIQAIPMETLFTGKNEKDQFTYEISDPDRLIMLVYTSGTTGGSKGGEITYSNLFERKKIALPREYALDPSNEEPLKTYLTFPLYHMAGIWCWLSWAETGCTTFINEDPGNILHELSSIKVDFTLSSPTVLKLLAKRIKRGAIDKLGGLRAVGSSGAPMDKETIEVFTGNGIDYCQAYGMTEATGDISYNCDLENHLTSVGIPSQGVEAAIIDGEICLRGSCIISGYYKRPKETAELIIDGYMHTGDIGFIDEEGYIYITGRKKNLIILSGGENVSPEELEKILYKNDFVKECKVVEKNDRIVAEVFADSVNHDNIREYVTEMNKTLPVYKRIYGVEFRDVEFEKTTIGKIRR